MDEPIVPKTAEALATHLVGLRETRKDRQTQARKSPTPRRSLKRLERDQVLAKTNGRCHICGGKVTDGWQADHVLSHGDGGAHAIDNYLAAHTLCNNYRWDYSPEEFQWVLKIGIWARRQMEKDSPLGLEMLKLFFDYEVRREKRHKKPV